MRARWVVACAGSGDGGQEGVPSPEVWRRLQQEEARRRGGKRVYSPGMARRMLQLLMEQRRARARARDRGRVRVVLSERFDRVA